MHTVQEFADTELHTLNSNWGSQSLLYCLKMYKLNRRVLDSLDVVDKGCEVSSLSVSRGVLH